MTAPVNRTAKCTSCGCDDDHACIPASGPCSWLYVDYQQHLGLCSECKDGLAEYVVKSARVVPESYDIDGPSDRRWNQNDYQSARILANSPCPVCQHPIGYENQFIFESNRAPVHVECAMFPRLHQPQSNGLGTIATTATDPDNETASWQPSDQHDDEQGHF